MKKPFNLFQALILMASLFTASAVATPNGEQDVRNAALGFQTTWNRHDMVAFGKLFAPDADFLPVGGGWMKGRESIQLHHAWLHGTIPRDTPGIPKYEDPEYGLFRYSTIKFVHIDVRFLRSDVAVAHVNWELLKDVRAPKRQGLFTFVLTRQNGGWLIAAAHNTEINRSVKGISLSLAAIRAQMSSLFATPPAAVSNEAQDVQNAVLGFSTDWNRHDMVAFGKLFAPNADFVNVGGFWLKGRQGIQLSHAWRHGVIPENSRPNENHAHYGIFKHTTMKFVHTNVRFLRNDVALAHVNWELSGDPRTQNPRVGLLTFVLTHQNGGWLIAAGQNTEINREVH